MMAADRKLHTTEDELARHCPRCGSARTWHWKRLSLGGDRWLGTAWCCDECNLHWGHGFPDAGHIHLRFDRLTDGTLVAVHQGVAAIAHPPRHRLDGEVYAWTLAGDGFIDGIDRPHGDTPYGNLSVAHAAEALGVHLGVIVDGYEIAP